MKSKNTLLGTLLVIIGVILFVAKYIFNSSFLSLGPNDYWPMIILLIGAGFELVHYITMRLPAFLIPGGILITNGLLFFFEVFTDWKFSGYTWPVYIMSVAVGLFQFYIATGRRYKGILIALSIISGVAAVCILVILYKIMLGVFDFGFIIPAALILCGVVILLRKGDSAGRQV
jgi:hypothetical protein